MKRSRLARLAGSVKSLNAILAQTPISGLFSSFVIVVYGLVLRHSRGLCLLTRLFIRSMALFFHIMLFGLAHTLHLPRISIPLSLLFWYKITKLCIYYIPLFPPILLSHYWVATSRPWRCPENDNLGESSHAWQRVGCCLLQALLESTGSRQSHPEVILTPEWSGRGEEFNHHKGRSPLPGEKSTSGLYRSLYWSLTLQPLFHWNVE